MRKRRKSIQANLLFYFCVLIFLSVAILAVMLSINTSQVVLDYTKEEISNGLKQIEKGVDGRLMQATECFSSIILDDKIEDSLKEKYDIDMSLGFARAQDVSKTLWLLKKSYPYVSAIYIYDIKNQCFYHSENKAIHELRFETTELYSKFIAGENYYEWKNTKNVPGMPWESDKGYLTCALPLKENVKEEVLGYIFVSVDIKEIFEYIEDFEIINSHSMFLVSEENQILAASLDLSEEVQEEVTEYGAGSSKTEMYIDEQSNYLYLLESPNTGLKYGMLIPYQNIYSPIYRIWKLALIFMIPVVAMAFYLSYIFSKKMYRPIFTLMEHMKRVVIVDSEKTLIKEEREDEFGILYESFNQMVTENRNLMKELADEQEKQKLIQLRLFQEQINPHFLYNTLNSIYCLSNIYRIQEIADLSKALTDFYRLSLNKGKEMITIRNTLQHIRYYLKIQNVRYRGRYELRIKVKEELMDVLIPELIVQPLVENCIEHGLKDVRYSPVISIDIKESTGRLNISVSDTGCGISTSKLCEIKKILEDDDDEALEAFALKNIHDRLKLYYGKNSSLDLYSEAGRGTRIEITIPMQEGGE